VLSGAKFKKPLSHGDELLDFAPLNTTRETLMNPALNHPSTLPGGRGYWTIRTGLPNLKIEDIKKTGRN